MIDNILHSVNKKWYWDRQFKVIDKKREDYVKDYMAKRAELDKEKADKILKLERVSNV